MIVGEWLWLLNSLFNLLVIQFVEEVTKQHYKHIQKWLAAVGSGYVATITYELWWGMMVSLFVAVLILYARQWRTFFRLSSYLFVSSCLLGGLLTFMQTTANAYLPVWLLLVSATGFLYLLLRKWHSGNLQRLQQQRNVQVALQIGMNEMVLQGYIDSGNSSIEPLSGKPVHYVAEQAVRHLVPQDLLQALHQWDRDRPFTITMFPRFWLTRIRWVRIQTVSSVQLVLAFRVDSMQIGQEKVRGHYIVFTTNADTFPQQAMILLQCSVDPQQKGGE